MISSCFGYNERTEYWAWDAMGLRAIFAANLRRLRIKKGLSRRELALISGLSFTYIGILERGDRAATLDVIEKLALALQVAPTRLIAEMEEFVPVRESPVAEPFPALALVSPS